MRQATGTRKSPGEKLVKDIKRATRKHYLLEEKIRIVLDGLRGEDSIAALCRRTLDLALRDTSKGSLSIKLKRAGCTTRFF
jgi:hypothetical protein